MWLIKRKVILKRDRYQCRHCGTNNNLQVHHKQYHFQKATGFKKNPWLYCNSLLITLCGSCHQSGHQQFEIPVFAL